jgi:hypothetical protein
LTIGNSELSIIASHDLPRQGLRTSKPVVVDWRWYYHLPALAFWALALPLLAVVKQNRQRQAWAILLAPLVVIVASRMLTSLFSVPSGPAETFAMFLTTLATAWTIVWLLGPWLAEVRGGAAFLIALAMMYLVGLLSYLACFGMAYHKNLPPLAACYTLAVFGLLLPMLLARRSCRTVYSRSRFMTWLLLWMGLTMTGCMLLLDAAMTLITAAAGEGAVADLFIAAVPSAVFGVASAIALYVVNLPFMVVALRTDFYRERFFRVLRLKGPADQGPGAPGPADEAADTA